MNKMTDAPGDLVIATCDTIDIRFAGVGFENAPSSIGKGAGEPSIRFQLAGVRGQETMTRDNEFQRDLEQWAARRKTIGPDSDVAPSKMPGVMVFERITTEITDNVGTKYRWAGGRVAGGETEWEATRFFQPAPPPGASTLHFEFSVDGESTGKHCEVSL